MFRRRIAQFLPNYNLFDRLPVARPFKPYLGHPNVWALNRRSVAGAVAAGLFCGLIPGPFQVFGTLIWVLVARVNLPVAVVTTLYTNPVSIVPLYVFAVAYGQLILGQVAHSSMAPVPPWVWSEWQASIAAYWDWMLGLGPALAVGLPATMVTFAVLGYISVRVVWRAAVVLAWRRRAARRAQKNRT
ncbi:DUF2062 domain-containing protein [Limnobacter sp.]|uniref:DUF2062 domain-containing protein n=1 Tax=Limnobacter sp. TaxID=2003368 RepID=UPI0035148BF3